MAKYETISAKVPTGMREEAKRLGVDTNDVIRRALDMEIRRRKAIELDRELSKYKDVLDRVRSEDAVADIRADRDKR